MFILFCLCLKRKISLFELNVVLLSIRYHCHYHFCPPLKQNKVFTKLITALTINHCHSPTTHQQSRYFEVNFLTEHASLRCTHIKLRDCNPSVMGSHITNHKIVHLCSAEQPHPATEELRTATKSDVNRVAEFWLQCSNRG